MKKTLSNPIVALILTVIVVFGSTAVNTRVRLGRQCEVISERFYSGRDSETAIADSLRSLCSASEDILLLGMKYDVEDDGDTVGTIEQIRDALGGRSVHAASMYSDYQDLLKSTFALESTLARMQLSETDEINYAEAQHAASDAKARIDASTYNDVVRAFLKVNHRFPTPQIAALSGVSLPEAFA